MMYLELEGDLITTMERTKLVLRNRSVDRHVDNRFVAKICQNVSLGPSRMNFDITEVRL